MRTASRNYGVRAGKGQRIRAIGPERAGGGGYRRRKFRVLRASIRTEDRYVINQLSFDLINLIMEG